MNFKELAAAIAKAYRENPCSWTKTTFARNAAGEPALPSETDACKWCLAGMAIRLHGPSPRDDARFKFYDEVIRRTAPDGSGGDRILVYNWNDAQDSVDSVVALCEEIAAS